MMKTMEGIVSLRSVVIDLCNIIYYCCHYYIDNCENVTNEFLLSINKYLNTNNRLRYFRLDLENCSNPNDKGLEPILTTLLGCY